MNRIITKIYPSPCGLLRLGSWEGSLCLCDWLTENRGERVNNKVRRALAAEFEEGSSTVIEQAIRELDEYFGGIRNEFDIPLLYIGTDFQKEVWNALLSIRWGETCSYSNIAGRIGKPTSVRAVANAIGSNALSIIVPCHRVIGRDGSLTGYAGGLVAKKYLLCHEGRKLKV